MSGPGTSTNSRSGVCGNVSRNMATASISSLMGYIMSSLSRKVFGRGKAALLGGDDKRVKLIQSHGIERNISPKTMDGIE